jgi:hypothetical protein
MMADRLKRSLLKPWTPLAGPAECLTLTQARSCIAGGIVETMTLSLDLVPRAMSEGCHCARFRVDEGSSKEDRVSFAGVGRNYIHKIALLNI